MNSTSWEQLAAAASRSKAAIDERMQSLEVRRQRVEEGEQALLPPFPPPQESAVRLDVGGQTFHTTVAALTSRRGFFRVLFGGYIRLKLDANECVFIDRSPHAFQLILDHLCGRQLPLNELADDMVDALVVESHFYELEDLQEELGVAAHRPSGLSGSSSSLSSREGSLQNMRVPTSVARDFDVLASSLTGVLERQEVLLVRETARLTRILNKINDCVSSEKIVLQLQDRTFATTRKTLTSQDGPLRRKFLREDQWRKDVNPKTGAVFIDANSSSFLHILNLLRGYPEPMGLSQGQRNSMQHDLEYFGGLSWTPAFQPSRLRRHMDSAILLRFGDEGVQMFRQLQIWLGRFELGERLYHRNDGQKNPAEFHAACDRASQTLLICRSKNNVFGGFSSISWGLDEDESDCYKEAEGCWLFTLSNPHNVEPTKFKCVNSEYAVFCSVDFGPAFGLGRDLVFWYYDTDSCYSNFPQSYEDTTGKGCSLFTGSRLFSFDEIEVFDVLG